MSSCGLNIILPRREFFDRGIICHWPVAFGPLMSGLQARLLADLERSPPEVLYQIALIEVRKAPGL